jgi:dTDP-glucose 4,6-dehydratase
MLEYAREVKPETFIQISTDEVYGAVQSKHDDLRLEWDPIVPSNPYAASKSCQEAIAISYWRTYGVPVIITNTMNNFGEYQQPNKFPVIVQKAVLNNEEVTIHGEPDGSIGSRSYIHSRNFADGVLFILKNLPPHMHEPLTADKPDRYNITGDRQLDNLEFAKLIAQLMGKELKYKVVDSHSARPGHDPHYGLDGRKLESAGWKSPLSFEDSLKNTIEWQSEHPEWINQ